MSNISEADRPEIRNSHPDNRISEDSSKIRNSKFAIRNAASEIRDSASEIRNSFSVLRQFVKRRKIVERCELCSAELLSEHEHLVEPASRQMVCACQACAILFSGKKSAKYRRVPRRIRYLSNFQLTDAQWENLTIPINMAFFFYSTAAEKVLALYPSPAGATESLLDIESWDDILQNNPILRDMEPDTEALLVNRVRGAAEYYLLPIDECYKLVGLIRAYWHGLSGGSEVWEEIGKFFAELKLKASDEGVQSSVNVQKVEQQICS